MFAMHRLTVVFFLVAAAYGIVEKKAVPDNAAEKTISYGEWKSRTYQGLKNILKVQDFIDTAQGEKEGTVSGFLKENFSDILLEILKALGVQGDSWLDILANLLESAVAKLCKSFWDKIKVLYTYAYTKKHDIVEYGLHKCRTRVMKYSE
ncbi:hypothetical protein AAHC03_09994 [Spirometra sp. Aus1]